MTELVDLGLRRFARSLAMLRLAAVGGQLLAIALVTEALHLPAPVLPLLAGTTLLGLVCALSILRLSRPEVFTPTEIVLWFALDIAELTYVLYLTGGASNPLVTLLIMPIALAAMALPVRHLVIVTALAGSAYGLLIGRNIPLPLLHAHDPGSEFSAHLLGMAVTFAVCGGLLAFFISRLAGEARTQAAIVQQERERALRDEGLLAIAIQAAGAAHELNTPLSSLATLVSELRRENANNRELSGDLELLAGQIGRCRDILRGLVAASTGQLHDGGSERSIGSFVASCVDRLRLLRPALELQLTVDAAHRETRMRASADLDHSLINLLDNAAEASELNGSNAIHLKATRQDAHAVFEVRDFGPGPPRESNSLGRRFFSSKSDGLGIGLALASATTERYRGSLRMESALDGAGTLTILSIPLADAGASDD